MTEFMTKPDSALIRRKLDGFIARVIGRLKQLLCGFRVRAPIPGAERLQERRAIRISPPLTL